MITVNIHILVLIAFIIIDLNFIIFNLSSKFLKYLYTKHIDNVECTYYDANYNEEEIIAHLDFIINECIDYYALTVLKIKDIPYINTSQENNMITTIGEEVTKRLSDTLVYQLGKIYHKDILRDVIAKRIYLTTTAYIIDYNTAKK